MIYTLPDMIPKGSQEVEILSPACGLANRKEMGSTTFGAIGRSPARHVAPQDMEVARGSSGCATANDRT
jgi:hypothetical protein